MRTLLSVAIVLSLHHIILADVGPCRYDGDRCSCRIGEANQGTCWDKIENAPGQCSKRFCRAGWTCACGGRTHVCYRSPKSINTLKNAADITKSTAECVTTTFPLVVGREISLGTIRFHFSRAGTLANDCTQVAWWHNGELIKSRQAAILMTSAVVDEELKKREEHSLFELRPGDLIAFRFREGSYYCYKHFTEMVINGTSVNSETLGFKTFYAREYSENWFMPSYVLTDANTAEDESEPDIRKFLPLRSKKLSSDTTIVPGNDYWEPRDDSNSDNKRSNWYFRIQVPDEIPSLAL